MNDKMSISSLSWGILASRGIIAKLFGLVVLIAYPITTFHARAELFATFALVFGAFSIWSGHNHPITKIKVLEIIQGLVSIGVGIIAFLPLVNTDRALFFFIAIWAIIIGGIKIILSYAWDKTIPNRWLPRTSGILSIAVGLFLLLFLSSADVFISSLYIGTYLIIFGILVFSFALNLRALQKHIASS
jgi:uncharacterized membrane protein HdeD (DUF308 family)